MGKLTGKKCGRPEGSRDALPRGMAKALKALRHRVPDDLSPEAKAVADEAMATVVNVMRGQAGKRFIREKLTAASMVREELCGAVPKKVDVQVGVTLEQLVPPLKPRAKEP